MRTTLNQLLCVGGLLFGAASSAEEMDLIDRVPAAITEPTPVKLDTTGMSLRDIIVNHPDLEEWRRFLEAIDVLENLLDDANVRLTVFAPTNVAMKNSGHISLFSAGMDERPPRWHDNMVATAHNHIHNETVSSQQLFDLVRTELPTMYEPITVSQWSKRVGPAAVTDADLQATNGVLHIVSAVVDPDFFDHSFARLELQPEYGPDYKNRISMVDVVDLVHGRPELQVVRESGTTYAGCRIRAFNRMGLDDNYLWQSINGGRQVKENELMNATMANHTLDNFVKYHLIPTNFYIDQLPNNFVQLVTPLANCGHMWVTKRAGNLCFNDGCVVAAATEPRQFLATNGVGYVIDRCPICPGVAMLTNYAAEFTTYSVRDVAQLFIGSEWNLRDLSLSLPALAQAGNKVTMFAALNSGFDFFTLEDTTRISTDKWRRHLWDLLKHCLLPGEWRRQDLLDEIDKNRGQPITMTMLTGENVTFSFDKERNMLMLNEGDIFFSDMRGVDGLLHFTTHPPKPKSITHNAYTIAKENPRFKIHTDYIDTVFLQDFLKELAPITVFYAPNEALDGRKFELLELSEILLENHVFKELLWCEKLVKYAEVNYKIESHNGRLWKTTLNHQGMPCLDATDEEGNVFKACVTKCDTLIRNGIVHELDTMLIYEHVETRAPQPPVAPVAPLPQIENPNADASDAASPVSAPSYSRPKPGNSYADSLNNQQSSVRVRHASATVLVLLLWSVIQA